MDSRSSSFASGSAGSVRRRPVQAPDIRETDIRGGDIGGGGDNSPDDWSDFPVDGADHFEKVDFGDSSLPRASLSADTFGGGARTSRRQNSSSATFRGASDGIGSRRHVEFDPAVNSTSREKGFQHEQGTTLNVLPRAIVRPKATGGKQTPKYGPPLGIHEVPTGSKEAVELMANLETGPFGGNLAVYVKYLEDGTIQMKLAYALNWYGQSVSYTLKNGCLGPFLQMVFEDMLLERIGGNPGEMLEQVFEAFEICRKHVQALAWLVFLSEYKFFTPGKEPNHEVIKKLNMTINVLWLKIWNQAEQMHFRGWFGITKRILEMEPHLLTLPECAPPRTTLGKAGAAIKKVWTGKGRP
jgi:hypothetical protein